MIDELIFANAMLSMLIILVVWFKLNKTINEDIKKVRERF